LEPNIRRLVFRASLLAGLLCVLADVDHIPYALGLCSEGRPLHVAGAAVALLGGLWGLGILSIGREAAVILLIEFTRRVRDALRLFLDEPITPNTQTTPRKVSENDN